MIIVLIAILLVVVYVSVGDEPDPVEDEPIVSPVPEVDAIEPEEVIESEPYVNDSLVQFIGRTSDEIAHMFGEPLRIDKTEFQYSWWVYGQSHDRYMKFAIAYNNEVVSAIGIGRDVNVAPFEIGQDIKDVRALIDTDHEIEFDFLGTNYTFQLMEEDRITNPLVVVDEYYAQVYVDKFTGVVAAVRFMDEETLVKLRPYQMTYIGELYEVPELPAEEWQEVQIGYERSIFELVNVLRVQFDLAPFIDDREVSAVARAHSQDMFERDFFDHQTPEGKTLMDRMNAKSVTYFRTGENIAANHVDGMAAVIGWLNSESHRVAMLDTDYKYVGSGVYRKYYTQNFIEVKDEGNHD